MRQQAGMGPEAGMRCLLKRSVLESGGRWACRGCAPVHATEEEVAALNGKALQDTAQKRAEELPATTLYSFEPGWEAVRVVDKWFMLVTEAPGRPVVILKSRLS